MTHRTTTAPVPAHPVSEAATAMLDGETQADRDKGKSDWLAWMRQQKLEIVK